MQLSKIDAILSAWQNAGETLSYSRIKHHLVGKGIIKRTNDRSLSRWLKKLIEEDYLKKTKDGYILKMKPKAYQVFDYVNELRQKYRQHIYEGEVGGLISHLCASTYLNFDETLLQGFDEKLAFDIISIRLGELFGALYLLRNDVIKRQCGLTQLRLNDVVVRETLFGLLKRSTGEHLSTEELVKNHSRRLRSTEKKAFDNLWKLNKPKTINYLDHLEHDFFFDKIEENPEGYKRSLKREASIDIEKYTLKELIDKFIEIIRWIERNHKKDLEEKHSFQYTQKESELENNFRTAILVKIAECIKAIGTSTEDFGIILTRHPATMNEYHTPEHILYEAMMWASTPPKDRILKKWWKEEMKKEETFEAMVAERLSAYNNLNQEVIESLRSKPWVKKELSKLGSFDKILKIYNRKMKKRLKNDKEAEKRLSEMLGGPIVEKNESL